MLVAPRWCDMPVDGRFGLYTEQHGGHTLAHASSEANQCHSKRFVPTSVISHALAADLRVLHLATCSRWLDRNKLRHLAGCGRNSVQSRHQALVGLLATVGG